MKLCFTVVHNLCQFGSVRFSLCKLFWGKSPSIEVLLVKVSVLESLETLQYRFCNVFFMLLKFWNLNGLGKK